MSAKKSAPFKRFASAMSRILSVSKEELARREDAYRKTRPAKKPRTPRSPTPG